MRIYDGFEDFWDDWGEVLLGSLISMAIFLACIFGGAKMAEDSCIARTVDIGLEHRWSALGGCQIEINDGQWIPLENYYYNQE